MNYKRNKEPKKLKETLGSVETEAAEQENPFLKPIKKTANAIGV